MMDIAKENASAGKCMALVKCYYAVDECAGRSNHATVVKFNSCMSMRMCLSSLHPDNVVCCERSSEKQNQVPTPECATHDCSRRRILELLCG